MTLCVTRHHAQTHFKFRALGHTCLGWPVFVGAAFQLHKICWSRTRPSNQAVGSILTSSSFLDQIPDQKVWNLGAYILHHTKITESNCWVLLDPKGGKTVFRYTRRYVYSSNSCCPYGQNCWRTTCASLYHSIMWGFTGRLLSSQKFLSPGGGFVLVSMCTFRLPFQTNSQMSSRFYPYVSPFRFQFFWTKVLYVWPYRTAWDYFPFSKSPESLGDEEMFINSLCSIPSTQLVKRLTVVRVAVMSPVASVNPYPSKR